MIFEIRGNEYLGSGEGFFFFLVLVLLLEFDVWVVVFEVLLMWFFDEEIILVWEVVIEFDVIVVEFVFGILLVNVLFFVVCWLDIDVMLFVSVVVEILSEDSVVECIIVNV